MDVESSEGRPENFGFVTCEAESVMNGGENLDVGGVTGQNMPPAVQLTQGPHRPWQHILPQMGQMWTKIIIYIP